MPAQIKGRYGLNRIPFDNHDDLLEIIQSFSRTEPLSMRCFDDNQRESDSDPQFENEEQREIQTGCCGGAERNESKAMNISEDEILPFEDDLLELASARHLHLSSTQEGGDIITEEADPLNDEEEQSESNSNTLGFMTTYFMANKN